MLARAVDEALSLASVEASRERNSGSTEVRGGRSRPQRIEELRGLHASMDQAILACCGWSGLDPGHGFHQNERGHTRFTVSPAARREILRRLLEMNLEIAAKETSGLGTS